MQLLDVLSILCAGVALAASCVLLGAWIMHRGRSGQSEGFIRQPKGQVFTIPVDDAADFPEETDEAQKRVLGKTAKFLDLLGGAK